eukprot:GHVP01068517.1.p1 GENE.GHVP01068517.1~~GHVP01068517.1.p1  ORF type:complete len:104 (+),score=8.11 GHVP01068517.1:327-638(+)
MRGKSFCLSSFSILVPTTFAKQKSGNDSENILFTFLYFSRKSVASFFRAFWVSNGAKKEASLCSSVIPVIPNSCMAITACSRHALSRAELVPISPVNLKHLTR